MDQLHRHLVEKLVRNHLDPINRLLAELTRVSRQVLLSNAANLLTDLFERLGSNAEADRVALLDNPIWPGGGRNPLAGRVSYQELEAIGLPEVARVRSTCCLRHRLPGSRPCTTCPRLTREERVALLRELAPQT